MRKRFWIVGFVCSYCLLPLHFPSWSAALQSALPTYCGRCWAGKQHLRICSLSDTASAYRTCDSCWKCAWCIRRHTAGDYENPLAEPGMIGINAGSALFVVLWISYGANAYYSSLSNVKVLFMPLLAIAGGILHCSLSICVFMAQGNPPDSLSYSPVSVSMPELPQ